MLFLLVLTAASAAFSDWARAAFSLATTLNSSPNSGRVLNPVIATGVEGVACLIGLPPVVSRFLTLAYELPATMKSPGFKVPLSTRA